MAGLTVCNYLFGLLLHRKQRKAVLVLGVGLNVAFLCFFKYLTFLLTQVLGLQAAELSIAAPLGISFFTFKSISYLADTYRKPENGTRSLSALLLYVSFFPQIVTGPITRFADFAPQLESRSHDPKSTVAGLRRFIVGLAKKLILSGTLGTMVDGIFALPESTLNAPLA
jgi:alginate O-acetyltransferase complex protein AlgI